MIKNLLTVSVLALSTSTVISAQAGHITSDVVNVASCSKMANATQPFILELSSGDNLLVSISQCAKAAKLQGASISGLGQLQNPTLAYFSSNPNDKPTLKTFTGFYELASLTGNISANGDSYYTHAHAALADKEFHGITGHVDNAKVGMTVEITITPLSAPVKRIVDAKTGFGLLVAK
jgi:predicted DNA-binding protein with PD1-like motif